MSFRLRFIILLFSVAAGSLAPQATRSSRDASMPYAGAGLSERQAAAHLLDRFTFGPTPGQVDEVVDMGLEKWFSRQLDAQATSGKMKDKLAGLKTLQLTNEEIRRMYPRGGRVRREAIDEGKVDPTLDEKEQRRALRAYYKEKGYRPQRQLVGELIAQKVIRAVDSPNQIEEVMVDFWFNHFYVSATDNQCRRFIGTYERDTIRPRVFTTFGDMLAATARHPAMLLYLDNAQSSAPNDAVTTISFAKDELRRTSGKEGRRYNEMFDRMEAEQQKRQNKMKEMPAESRRRRGINENYARELLELHTLGVDGGYSQDDVVEVARAFTGWTVLPDGARRERLIERLNRNSDLSRGLGFVVIDDFLFNPDWHDAGEKRILGRRFDEGGGIDEGERVLDMLSRHASTARHIAKKLAVHFVRDDPPDRFVDALAEVFLRTNGDIRSLLWQIVGSPDFWSVETRRAKIKSPFELAVSSVRGLDANVANPRRLVQWIDRMGQPLYRYQAPTGFPDRAEAWVNAGSLLHRMNFGMSLAAGNIRGVRVDLGSLQRGREPESPDAALRSYAAILLPERNLEETFRVLRPMLARPDVAEQIRERSDVVKDDADAGDALDNNMAMENDELFMEADDALDDDTKDVKPPAVAMTVMQVVGLILGSPEFQRR